VDGERIDVMESIKRIGLLIIGWFFIVLGILGLFLPILQGILFILIGLAILSSRSETIKRLLKHLEERYPQYHEKIEVWNERVRKWFKKD
jgi:uncharacterized membrane protein YbaN (DUF454 family)